MSDSIPKRNGIDPSSAETNTPAEGISSPAGEKRIDFTKEDSTVENEIKEEPRCIGDMPDPVLEEILKNLPLHDLKTAVLLSIKWRLEGERPELWKGSKVRVHNRDEIKKLSIQRLKHLEELDVQPGDQWEDADWEAFFEATLSLSRLKVIRGLAGRTLLSVDPETLANALSKLGRVDLRCTRITNDQAEELFKKIYHKKHDLTYSVKSVDQEGAPRQNTGLKMLCLVGINLSAVDAKMMGKAIAGLKEVALDKTSLTESQGQELFAQMSQGSQLKVLDLRGNNLSAVDAEMMAKAIGGLEEVNLVRTSLTESQVQQLFAQMSQGSQLKVLDLRGNNLSAVDPVLMAKAIAGLEKVALLDTSLTEPQVQQLFAQMSRGTQLKVLYLSGSNLSAVDPEMVGKAIAGLEKVILHETSLTESQVQQLFAQMTQNSQLKLITLSRNNLAAVDPLLMGKVIAGLEDVSLYRTSLTAPQVQQLFAQMTQGSQLKKITLSRNNLSSVDPEMMGKAIAELEEVALHDTSLTEPQVQELFAQMSQGSQLKVLFLSFNNLSSVEPEMMGKAIAELEEVALHDTSLTEPQVQELFAQMSRDSKLKKLYLDKNDLSSLDPEALGRAVHRLEEVSLRNTNLTIDQYDRIVSGGDGQSKCKKLLLWDPNENVNVDLRF